MILLLLVWLAAPRAQAPPSLPEERPILDEIAAYDEQITALDAQLGELDAKVSTAEDQRLLHASQAAEAKARLDHDRVGVRHLVQAYYKLSRRGVARLLFDAESPTELRRRVYYLYAVVQAHEVRTRSFAELAQQHADADAAAKAESEAVTALRGQLAERRTQLDTERARRVKLLQAVHSNVGLSMRATQEVVVAQSDFDQSVRTHEATAPAAPNLTGAFRAARGQLPAPVQAGVLHAFGPRDNPGPGEPANNLGIDYAAPSGTPFRAVADGQVTRSGYVKGYGQVVMLQHGSYTTLYAHASGLRVSEGQQVRQGDVLGLVGTTGLLGDSGAQLHFEVRYNGTPQDPADWLAR